MSGQCSVEPEKISPLSSMPGISNEMLRPQSSPQHMPECHFCLGRQFFQKGKGLNLSLRHALEEIINECLFVFFMYEEKEFSLLYDHNWACWVSKCNVQKRNCLRVSTNKCWWASIQHSTVQYNYHVINNIFYFYVRPFLFFF